MAVNYHKVLDLLATVGLNAGIGAGFGGLLGMLPSSYATTKEEKRKRLLRLIATGGTIGGVRGTFAYFRPDPNEKKTYELPEAEDSTSPQKPSSGPKKTNEPVYGPVDIANVIKDTGALKSASYNSLYKQAGIVPNKGDVNSVARTKHNFYDVPFVNGRPKIPRIAPPSSPQATGVKNPPILEYRPVSKQYQLHQYPYMKHDYPTISNEMQKQVDKLLSPGNKLFSPATKANYRAMTYKGDPATPLQYAEYLKWRNATGGKTLPK